ncbi:MAG: hypothetical protein Q7T45_00395 [Bradyrhizobium sp.]|uniref:hypothetical protein n=1 Tax=Bradyrhizobium sp. TaxID=376 RepID=UPI002726D99E|nr:hypothetical protein [Bradyrhizobium sp.]MDO8396258.1 hypothetical protein [Bradyrhizobium sp.]
MDRALQFVFIILVLLCGTGPARAAEGPALERGAAITDPLALRELDRGRFAVARVMVPERSVDIPLTCGQLFTLPSMAMVRTALDAEFERYIVRHKAGLPNESIGVGTGHDFQLFDRAVLYSDDARFVLAGIVNRMDRAFASPESCGEVRLIYRLARTGPAGEDGAPRRLPMTLNIVLKARGGGMTDAKGAGITCAGIARRWLDAGESTLTGADLVARLLARDGPLDLIRPENIDRIETNLQIAHAPKSAVREFRTDYLLKVFRFDSTARAFDEAPMENQIDRERILANADLGRDFKAWLLDPRHLNEFDRGTVLIPERFLARAAIASTPVGFDPSELQPEYGLVQGEGANPVFSESEIVAALRKAADVGVTPANIRSVAGFRRRLNDVTCSGCHQTRGIGGFHFPGVDWMAAKPSNSTVVPASPHFFGDQIRRRDILNSMKWGSSPDYSRGFSERPQLRTRSEFLAELKGTGHYDGWGAHCYQPSAKAADDDPSFRNWTCAAGLACEAAGKTSRIGMCFVKSR